MSGKPGKPNITAATSPVMIRVYEILKPDGDFTSPGEWMLYEHVITESMKAVTPGEAVREAERSRVIMARKEGRPGRPRIRYKDDYDVQVRSGQRNLARRRIWGSAHTEFRLNDEGQKEVRYAPGMGRLTHAGVRTRRMTGISTKNIPYRYRTEETSDHAGHAHGHDAAVPGADEAAHPQPEGG